MVSLVQGLEGKFQLTEKLLQFQLIEPLRDTWALIQSVPCKLAGFAGELLCAVEDPTRESGGRSHQKGAQRASNTGASCSVTVNPEQPWSLTRSQCTQNVRIRIGPSCASVASQPEPWAGVGAGLTSGAPSAGREDRGFRGRPWGPG